MGSGMNPYESQELLDQYLLFHYGSAEEVLPYPGGPRDARDFAVRTVSENLDAATPRQRALDLGCAVGRSSFELSKFCDSVLGIDFSAAFIGAAQQLEQPGDVQIPCRGHRHQVEVRGVAARLERAQGATRHTVVGEHHPLCGHRRALVQHAVDGLEA